ncbi:30S ribosome-binding factor RbfA [Candidatus Sumerlaeota bacterium]|nr:30S ribosome-binding factor RbfA [Candidatus Sumerlaeota bacterium]
MIPSRIKRVEELVKEQVALIIQRDVKDPRLDFVTVSSIHVAKDLRNADIYVTTFDETQEHIREIMEALKSATGFIRRLLGERIVLRYLPALKFHYDASFKQANRIDEILHQIENEK